MDKDKKDFKAVKVNIKSGTKNEKTVSKSMMYSGVNIFGHLTQIYMQNKDEFEKYDNFSKMSGASKQNTSQSQTNLQEDLLSLQNDDLMIFKKLQKKDPITKCKALRQLEERVQQTENVQNQEYINLITFFLYHYQRIMTYEADKQVREAAQNTFKAFLNKDVDSITPFFDQVFPVWFCSFFDSSQEVAKIGKNLFNQIFENKSNEIFKDQYKFFLQFANKNLRQSEAQITEDQLDLSKIQIEEVYDRLISQTLLALAESFDLVKSWTQENKEHFVKKMLNYLEIEQNHVKNLVKDEIEEEDKNQKQIQEQAKTIKKKEQKNQNLMWQFLTKKYRARIRSACLVFICQLIQNIQKSLVEGHLQELVPLIFEMVQEDNSIMQSCLWKDAYFTLGSQFSDKIWVHVNLKKNFIPGLMNCLKNAGFGASHSLYSNLVKFVSVFPVFQLVESTDDKTNKFSLKDKANFLSQFYQNLFSARKNDEAANYHQELTNSYFETLLFYFIKRFQPFAEQKNLDFENQDLKTVWAQLKLVIEMPIIEYIKKYEKFKSKIQNQRNIRQTIPEKLNWMLRELINRKLNPIIFEQLAGIIYDIMQENIMVENTFRIMKCFLKDSSQSKFAEQDQILNKHIIIKQVSSIFNRIKEDLKSVNASTISDFSLKCKLLQRLTYQYCRYTQFKDNQCFKIIKLNELIKFIKELDLIEEKSKKLMSQQAQKDLKQAKNQLLLLSLISMHRETEFFDEHQDATSLIQYVLIDSQQIELQQKNFFLLPFQSLPQEKFKIINNIQPYYSILRSNSSIVYNYITQILIQQTQNISQNYQTISNILEMCNQESKSIFEQSSQIKQILQQIIDKIENIRDYNEKSFYLLSVQCVMNKKDQKYFDNDQINKLQELLIEQLLLNVNNQGKSQKQQDITFERVWNIFDNTLKNQHLSQDFLNKCIIIFKKTMTSLVVDICEIKQGELSNEFSISYQQFNKINYLISILKDFSSLCEVSQRQQVFEQIILIEEIFVNCEQNCLPIKIFRDIFLEGGIGFDVQKLFSNQENEEQNIKYAWLALLFLDLKNMVSLNHFPELKKQLLVFRDTEVLPAILIAVKNGNNQLLFKLIENLKSKIESGKETCISTLENLLKYLTNNEILETFLKVDDFKMIFQILSKEKVQNFNNKNYNKLTQIDIKLITCIFRQISYYILDEPEIIALIKQVKKNLHIDILTKQQDEQKLREIIYSLSIYNSIYKHFLSDYDKEIHEFVTQWIIGNFNANFVIIQQADSKEAVFQLNTALQFLSQMTEELGMNQFIKIVSFLPDDTFMLTKQIDVKNQKEIVNQEMELLDKLEEVKKSKIAEIEKLEYELEIEYQNTIVDIEPENQEPKPESPQLNQLNEQLYEIIDSLKQKQKIVALKQKELNDIIHGESLETLILQVIKISNKFELFDPLMYINLNTLIRRVISFKNIISERQFIVDEIINIAQKRVQIFSSKLNKILNSNIIDKNQNSDESQQILYLEDEMLESFAETLIQCTQYISSKANENNLYLMLSSGFLPIQKASFFMLDYLYQNYIPEIQFTKNDEEEIKNLQLMAVSNVNQIETSINENTADDVAKESIEFKNVPKALIQQIENPPSIKDKEDEDVDQIREIAGLVSNNQQQIESLIFGSDKEGCINRKELGYLISWSCLLKKIDCGRIKSQIQERNDYMAIISSITEYLEQNREIYQMLLVVLIAYLPKSKKIDILPIELQQFDPSQIDISDPFQSQLMSLYTLLGFMKSFPSLARKYYQDCDKKLQEIIIPYIKQVISPSILDNEILKIETSQVQLKESGQGEGLTFSHFKSTKEIKAYYTKGEVSMELKIVIPTDYPLKSVSVEVGQQIKISDRQKNKWVLAIRNLLQIRNGDIISAVLLWKNNIDKEIDGMEECFICYCVLHPTDKSLPRMPCKNCKNKFHVSCIRKWFKTSNKSNCPLCQAYFF